LTIAGSLYVQFALVAVAIFVAVLRPQLQIAPHKKIVIGSTFSSSYASTLC
jgi:hypothetical protein